MLDAIADGRAARLGVLLLRPGSAAAWDNLFKIAVRRRFVGGPPEEIGRYADRLSGPDSRLRWPVSRSTIESAILYATAGLTVPAYRRLDPMEYILRDLAPRDDPDREQLIQAATARLARTRGRRPATRTSRSASGPSTPANALLRTGLGRYLRSFILDPPDRRLTPELLDESGSRGLLGAMLEGFLRRRFAVHISDSEIRTLAAMTKRLFRAGPSFQVDPAVALTGRALGLDSFPDRLTPVERDTYEFLLIAGIADQMGLYVEEVDSILIDAERGEAQ